MDSGNAKPGHPAEGTGRRSWRTKLQTALRVEEGSKYKLTGLGDSLVVAGLPCRSGAGLQPSTERLSVGRVAVWGTLGWATVLSLPLWLSSP